MLSSRCPIVAAIVCSAFYSFTSYAESREDRFIKILEQAPPGSLSYAKVKLIVRTLAQPHPTKAFKYTKLGIRGFFQGEENRYQAINLCQQVINIVKRSDISPTFKNKIKKQLSFEIITLQPGFIY